MSVLVGKQAPDFTVPAVLADGEIVDSFSFSDTTRDKYAVVFFYPLDFTFVCPSELIALDHRMDAFKNRGVEVIAVSVDSHFTHNAWRNTAVNEGGIGHVGFTMAADIDHQICKDYDVEADVPAVAYRGSFLIDQNGLVRHQVVNDLPLGRNIDEMIRMIDALQFHEEQGEVCPAGWSQGDSGMDASPAGVADYLSNHADNL